MLFFSDLKPIMVERTLGKAIEEKKQEKQCSKPKPLGSTRFQTVAAYNAIATLEPHD